MHMFVLAVFSSLPCRVCIPSSSKTPHSGP